MTIKGLDKDRKRIEDSFKVAKKHMRESAKGLAREQESLIEAGKMPSGRAQKPNAPKYAKRKKGKPPLERTGRLKDASSWRVRARGDEMVLRPPADRMTAVEILSRRGFRLVTDELPEGYDERLQEELDERLKAKGVI